MRVSPSCCGTPGLGNGGHMPDCPQRPDRTFDHTSGKEPWSKLFSRVAREMRAGVLGVGMTGPASWWQAVPDGEAQASVTGEIDWR